MTCDEVKPLLTARIDGELDAAQSALLDSHLAGCRSCAKDLERLYEAQTAVRTGLPYYPSSAVLRDRVLLAVRGAEYLDSSKSRRHWQLWGSVAAGFAVLGLIATSFVLNERSRRALVATEFLSAHQRALISRSVDVVSSDQHTVKPWFNGKLPFSPPAIDLAQEGFPLQGARLDYVGGDSVAVLVYQRRLHRIDVFVQPFTGKQRLTNFERNGFRELSWTRDGFLFTAVSDLNAADLATFAGLLQAR